MDGSFRPKNFQPRFYRFFDVVRVVFAVVVVVVVVLLLPLLPQLWIRIRRHRGVGGTDERIVARRKRRASRHDSKASSRARVFESAVVWVLVFFLSSCF